MPYEVFQSIAQGVLYSWIFGEMSDPLSDPLSDTLVISGTPLQQSSGVINFLAGVQKIDWNRAQYTREMN